MRMKEFFSGHNIVLASHAECIGCGACESSCPKNCIQMTEDREGFLQPSVNTKACIKCHKCEKVCPILNPERIDDGGLTKAYAAINKDSDVRRISSSGGVFYALARWTIAQGGVVFGARFDEQWRVVHDYAETLEGIIPFMGSKYVQSLIGDSYKLAKAFLDNGRLVLFTGTPCQLGGLRSFLGKEYDRLVQVDVICYGVPSPGVWRSYLKERSQEKGDITRISFRDKRDGWKHSRFIVSFNQGDEDVDGLFMKGFSYKAYLRKSCYECKFRHYHRNSDFTIADYWGVDQFCKEMYDDKGTSIVFSHSPYGDSIIKEISDSVKFVPESRDNAIANNPFMIKKHSLTDKRNRFYRIYRLTSSFKWSAFVINKDSIKVRSIRKIKKVLNRFSI